MEEQRTVVALFVRREDAHEAITKLIESGIRAERIGYLEPLDERDAKNPGKAAAKGIEAGGAAGAVLGAMLAAAAVGLIPGVGPALVAGSLLPVALGAAGGAATGAVAGGLLAVDMSSEDEPYFMQEVQAGRFLVSVEVEREADEGGVAALLSESKALEVDRLGTATLHARLRHPAANSGL